MEENNTSEVMSMTIIANSGECRARVFDALRLVRDSKDYEGAKKLLAEAEKYSIEAHKVQMDLLVKQANNEDVKVDVLLVHAQDHLMTTMVAQELITEMVEYYKPKEK